MRAKESIDAESLRVYNCNGIGWAGIGGFWEFFASFVSRERAVYI